MTVLLLPVLSALSACNSAVLRLGRNLAWVALAIMVFVTLLQVFCRYVLNAALPWPDEAARFMMLWMTGLVAPSAYRWGGFVSIDSLRRALPDLAANLLGLALLLVSGAVLVYAIKYGWAHTFGFGGKFESSSLRIPLDLVGGESVRLKLRYMYASLLTGVVLLLSVNVELFLRLVASVLDPGARLPDLGEPDATAAE